MTDYLDHFRIVSNLCKKNVTKKLLEATAIMCFVFNSTVLSFLVGKLAIHIYQNPKQVVPFKTLSEINDQLMQGWWKHVYIDKGSFVQLYLNKTLTIPGAFIIK